MGEKITQSPEVIIAPWYIRRRLVNASLSFIALCITFILIASWWGEHYAVFDIAIVNLPLMGMSIIFAYLFGRIQERKISWSLGREDEGAIK